jgi:hypothetical protein
MVDQEARDRFLLLVEEYRLAAWIGLGKLKDPASGETRRNLDLARHAIDTLGMLEQKTKGNLEVDEEKFLRQALTDLRLNFVEELRLVAEEKGGAGVPGSKAAEPARGEGPGPAPAPPGGA